MIRPDPIRKRVCLSEYDRYGSPSPTGGYRLRTQPSCNEQIFDLFRSNEKLSAADFKNVWTFYDSDMNGYIEADELTSFLNDLFTAQTDFSQGQHMSRSELESLRDAIIECYDANRDGKIEVTEMTKFLPVEKNFLLHFRMKGDGKMTCADFIEIWRHYDTDKSGYLEEKEIGSFLMDMIKVNQDVKISDAELLKMVEEVIKNFDDNNDGRIEFAEMKNLLNIEGNVLTDLSVNKNLTAQEFNTVFQYYDQNRSNYLEEEEIRQFAIDLMERAWKPLDERQRQCAPEVVLKTADKDGDGRLSREELASLLYTDTTEFVRSPSQRRSYKKKRCGSSRGSSSSGGEPASTPSGAHRLKDMIETYGAMGDTDRGSGRAV